MAAAVFCTLVYFVGLVYSVDVTLDIHDSHQERECYGSDMGFSFSGTQDYHYESLRRRYTGCTYVQGNLEITNLYNRTYDLSFLSTIKMVTGYVLLGLLNVETIPLTSLRFIRADNEVTLGEKNYTLVVALTAAGRPTDDNPNPGLKELQMPQLREISRGKVLFRQNPLLCNIDTIDWDVITHGQVINTDEPTDKPHCSPCHEECADRSGVRHCWGPGIYMCQQGERRECDSICPGPCFQAGIIGCCHPECAIGCTEGRNTDCTMCRHFRHHRRCVPACPEGTYPLAQECIEF